MLTHTLIHSLLTCDGERVNGKPYKLFALQTAGDIHKYILAYIQIVKQSQTYET